MTNSLKASVVICTYNRAHLLEECLNSASKQTLPRSAYEIIVVENSQDENIFVSKKEKLAKKADKFIRSSPPGLSRARNVGWQSAESAIVIFLDDDAVPEKGWLKSLLAAFENPNADCVGGRVMPLLASEPPAWLSQELFDYLSVVDYGDGTLPVTDGKWLVGANIAFRKNFLLRCGGFPESLGRVGNTNSLLSNDETPLLEQIRSEQRLVLYCGQARVAHYVEPERLTKDWFRRRVIWQAISDVLKGEKLSSAELTSISERYQAAVSEGKLVGRSLYGLMTRETTREIFPGEFGRELGFLYQCTRYLVESGSRI